MEHIAVTRERAVTILQLNRPPANAIDLAFARQLESAFAEVTAIAEVRALVLTGTGSCFSAGLDLKVVPQYAPDQQRAMVTAINRMVAQLYACRLPVVAAVNGHAVAGGLILALACDYRVATSAASKLGVTEARAGIPFPAAAMAVLQAELPPHVARVMTLRANNIGPQAALASGLVDELQASAHVLPRAIEVAHDFAGIPGEAYARIKHQLRATTIDRINAMIARGSDPALESWLTSEAGAASAALLRQPH